MTPHEYVLIRITELEARRNYAAQLVMNRDMAHEVKMCDAQIKALNKLLDPRQPIVTENPLEKIGPFVQYWTQGSNPVQLMHTDDNGHDTILCEDHLTDDLIACSNCIQLWPVNPA